MKIKHFNANTKGRDFVVGDLHGCYDDFFNLLGFVNFDFSTDRVFSVGDLCDRGRDSVGCLNLLKHEWFSAVMGNHEEMMLLANNRKGANGEISRNAFDSLGYWYGNGGSWWNSVSTIDRASLLELVSTLPLAMVIGDGDKRFNVIHAEFFGDDDCLDKANWDSNDIMRMLWGRSLVGGYDLNGMRKECGAGDVSITYVGHTILPEVKQISNHVFIDTGAFTKYPPFGKASGRLTMIQTDTGGVFQS